jgi:hypothetical protein
MSDHPLRVHRRAVLVMAVAPSLLSAGCFRRQTKWEKLRPKTYAASGLVLWDGKPEAGVFVTFESRSHNLTAVGITDAAGRFTLKTWKEGDGAVAGEHAVRLEKKLMIKPASGSGDPGGRFGGGSTAVMNEVSVLPKQYGDFATSGLTATVVEKGPNEFTFEITGARPQP